MQATHKEAHSGSAGARLNWLRASVLGANDGIVSLAALVVGVAGATADVHVILVTGVAGLLAGALSMAVGEYVSVSSQRDTELALVEKERMELRDFAPQELEELVNIYERKGLSRSTAEQAARELTEHDALAAHLDAELGIDPAALTNPWHAAFASGASFVAGALIPLIAITMPPEEVRVPVAFGSVVLALLITGIFSARVSEAPVAKVVLRIVSGGVLAMAITFGVGMLFGVAVG
jgi:VIT1/CCC1 family predicted Fe2+/Mn2+ transporter